MKYPMKVQAMIIQYSAIHLRNEKGKLTANDINYTVSKGLSVKNFDKE